MYSRRLIDALREELANERVILYVKKGWNDGAQREGQSSTEGGSVLSGAEPFVLPPRWEVCELGWPGAWTQGGLALTMLFDPPDVLLVPAHTVPWIHPARTVVVIHGLEFETCPEAYPKLSRQMMRFFVRRSCQWASTLIAVSESTKRDVVRLYRVPETKIHVVHEGVNTPGVARHDFITHDVTLQDPVVTSEGYSSSETRPYFLFVGRLERRKNIVRMIHAFRLFKKRCGTKHQLLLAGKPGYGYADIVAVRKGVADSSDIIELGYVSEEKKWTLLQNADAFLFPSLAEGFGLPVLEAGALGVPALISDIPALREVAGDGAVLADPLDVESIAQGMERLALDPMFRGGIIERGRANAARFGWKRCAELVAQVLCKK